MSKIRENPHKMEIFQKEAVQIKFGVVDFNAGMTPHKMGVF